MITRTVIYPFKMGSESGKKLAKGLGAKRVYADGNYKSRSNHLIINWGNSTQPNWDTSKGVMLNKPEAVARAVDKIETFRILQSKEIPIPQFSTNKADVASFDKKNVVCRQTATGHGGEGITITKREEAVDAKFYTGLIKGREFRVHIFLDRIIDIQQKKRRVEALEDETLVAQIKNHANGWVFCRENISATHDQLVEIGELAKRAVSALGLDFGAVDVIYNKTGGYILEVNCACGMEGRTLENYLSAFNNLL